MARFFNAPVLVALVVCVGVTVSALSDGSESRYAWADAEGTGNNMATGIFLTEAAKMGAVCLDGTAPAYYFLPGTEPHVAMCVRVLMHE